MRKDRTNLFSGIGTLIIIAGALFTACTVNVKEGYYPPFITAAQMGDIAEADRLFRSGQLINQKTIGNQTALHLAAAEGQNAMVEWLLDREADFSAQDQNGKTPADFAHERRKTSTEDLNKSRIKLFQEEVTAIQNRDKTTLKELLSKDNRHYTLLHIFAQLGIIEEAIKQIQSGSDVNAKTTLELTPLHKAVVGGKAEIVQALIKAGADVNALDVYNDTPLYVAASQGKKEILVLLLASGADKSIKSRLGKESPLDVARRFGHQDVIEPLQK